MYAVLGATGRVGGAAVRELRRRGLPVRAVVRDSAKAEGLVAVGCEIVTADLHDAVAVRAALAGASGVHVILPMNGTAPDGLADADRIIAAIGDAIDRARPRQVVAISDYGAHNASGIGLTTIWHRLEQRLRTIPVATTVVRSAEHMQSWGGALRVAAGGGVVPLLHQPLTKSLPTVSAPDVGVIAAVILAASPGEAGATRVVHVEGPRRYTVAEVLGAMADLVGRPVDVRELPPDEWVPSLVARGLSESYARLVAEMMSANNAGRMDVEPGAREVRRGTTTLAQAFADMLGRGRGVG
jgi:NAD(P)H dehydrogenase (quinone)